MYYHAQRVDSLYCSTTISKTLLFLYWLKFALRSLLNQSWQQLVDDPDECPLATSNIPDGACQDVAMNPFCDGLSKKCCVDDVRVFNPYAASNKCSKLSTGNIKHKSCAYSQWLGRWNMLYSLHLFCQPLGGCRYFYKCLVSTNITYIHGAHAVVIQSSSTHGPGKGAISFNGLNNDCY